MSRFEDGRQVEVLGLGRPQALVDLEHLAAADHLVDGPEAELGHDLTKLFGHEVEEVDDLLWLSGELGPKQGVLAVSAVTGESVSQLHGEGT